MTVRCVYLSTYMSVLMEGMDFGCLDPGCRSEYTLMGQTLSNIPLRITDVIWFVKVFEVTTVRPKLGTLRNCIRLQASFSAKEIPDFRKEKVERRPL